MCVMKRNLRYSNPNQLTLTDERLNKLNDNIISLYKLTQKLMVEVKTLRLEVSQLKDILLKD